MPIYEYECSACHEGVECLQKLSDPPLITCPSCQKKTLKRKISLAGFRLKGSGWYETDFKKDKQKNLSDNGEKAKNKATPSTSEKKTTAKDTPAPKSSKKPPATKT